MRKFMVAFDEKVFRELDKDAKSRNITFQAVLRAVVIPALIRGENRTMPNHPAMGEDSQRDWSETLSRTEETIRLPSP